MKVPLLDLQAQLEYLEDDLIQAVTRVVKSTRYIQGPEVTGLEEEIAHYCEVEHGIGVTKRFLCGQGRKKTGSYRESFSIERYAIDSIIIIPITRITISAYIYPSSAAING